MTSKDHNKDEKAHDNHHEKDDKDARIAELTDTCKRVQAEFENFRKRCERDNEEFKKFAARELIEKILPILDSLEIALKHTSEKQEFVKGVEMIYNQFKTLLAQEGLRVIPALNKKYDPYVHEALLQEEAHGKDGIILEELQAGYMLNDRVLRHSKVKVGKDKEGKDGKQKGVPKTPDKQADSKE